MACKERPGHLMLAERASVGSISLCDCGTIHVAMGSVTVRLSPEVFCELVVMCRSAADMLMRQATAMERPVERVH